MGSLRVGLALAMVFLVGTSACKKTVEGERASWERNVQRVRDLTVLYPGFRGPIEEQLARAQQAMEASGSASEQERPAKMAAANRLLNSGFVLELGRLDGKIKGLSSKVTDATAGAKDSAARQSAKFVAEDTGRVLAEVNEAVKRGASDAAGAAAIMTRIKGDLEAVERNVEVVLKAQRQAAKEAQASSSSGSPGSVAKPAAQPATAQAWKCSYCGNANAASVANCTSCGAPSEK